MGSNGTTARVKVYIAVMKYHEQIIWEERVYFKLQFSGHTPLRDWEKSDKELKTGPGDRHWSRGHGRVK